jgi:hypothetical protein
LSVLMVLSFVGAAYLNPEIWLPDYPPDIRERFGPMSERAKIQGLPQKGRSPYERKDPGPPSEVL